MQPVRKDLTSPRNQVLALVCFLLYKSLKERLCKPQMKGESKSHHSFTLSPTLSLCLAWFFLFFLTSMDTGLAGLTCGFHFSMQRPCPVGGVLCPSLPSLITTPNPQGLSSWCDEELLTFKVILINGNLLLSLQVNGCGEKGWHSIWHAKFSPKARFPSFCASSASPPH